MGFTVPFLNDKHLKAEVYGCFDRLYQCYVSKIKLLLTYMYYTMNMTTNCLPMIGHLCDTTIVHNITG